MEVSLIDFKSFFTEVPIPTIWLVLATIGAAIVIFRSFRLRSCPNLAENIGTKGAKGGAGAPPK
jgi:hypothetical protein